MALWRMAFWSIDLDRGGELDHFECTSGLVRTGIRQIDAERIYRLLDIDKSEHISKTEMVSALQLSSPSIVFEDFRRLLRSRFQSIHDVFERQIEERLERNSDAHVEFSLEQFQECLQNLGMTRQDTKRLFSLIDADESGTLTMMEILRGVRLFAPAVVLQGIRQDLQVVHGEISHAFADVECPSNMMDFDALRSLLEAKGVQNRRDDLRAMFDMLILRSEQGMSVNQLIAALQAAQSGLVEKPSSAECSLKAKKHVYQDLATDRKSVV